MDKNERKPGKTVGYKTYVHRDYAHLIVDVEKIRKAEKIAGITEYTTIRYDRLTESIAFQYSPDFDTADEPTLAWTVTVKSDGTVSRSEGSVNNPQIWHHKWMWVGDDYTGFDVEASKERSRLWEPLVSKEEKSKIGYKGYWDSIKGRWE
jgi:hypothetical protein